MSAIDPEGQPVTFYIGGGADASLFWVDPSAGRVGFSVPPDHESVADADGDNVYEVTLIAQDPQGAGRSQTYDVRVHDVNEAPTVTAQSFVTDVSSVGQGPIGLVAATDPDHGDTLAFELSGGPPGFSIDPATGALGLPELAGQLEIGREYVMDVLVSDAQGLSSSATVSVRIEPAPPGAPETAPQPAPPVSDQTEAGAETPQQTANPDGPASGPAQDQGVSTGSSQPAETPVATGAPDPVSTPTSPSNPASTSAPVTDGGASSGDRPGGEDSNAAGPGQPEPDQFGPPSGILAGQELVVEDESLSLSERSMVLASERAGEPNSISEPAAGRFREWRRQGTLSAVRPVRRRLRHRRPATRRQANHRGRTA